MNEIDNLPPVNISDKIKQAKKKIATQEQDTDHIGINDSIVATAKNINLEPQIITFMGSSYGVGNTELAFNTAISLAQEHKVLYVSLDTNGSTVEYDYQLKIKNKSFNELISDVGKNTHSDSIDYTKYVINYDDLFIKLVSTQSFMQSRIKRFPAKLSYLLLDPIDLSIYSADSLKEMLANVTKRMVSSYDIIVFDTEANISLPFTLGALSTSDSIVLSFTQNANDFRSAKQRISALSNTLKQSVNIFPVVNKYSKTALSKLDVSSLSNLINCRIEGVIPAEIDAYYGAAFNAVPMILHPHNEEYQHIILDLTKKLLK